MKTVLVSVLAATVLALAPAAHADEDHASRDALLQRMEALEQRVAALEAARSFTRFMPDYAERFHVMHRAGEAAARAWRRAQR